MDKNNSVKVCCDMIIEKDGKLLMGKRGNVFGKGSWALPGGHLEVNEKTVDCVVRELDEEVGIKPLDMKLLGVVNDVADVPGQTGHYVRFVYHIVGYSGEITNKEPDKCEGWEWFDKNKLPEPTFVGHIKILKFFLNKQNEFFLE
jgi:8-oxo-dGTP diphosphatase